MKLLRGTEFREKQLDGGQCSSREGAPSIHSGMVGKNYIHILKAACVYHIDFSTTYFLVRSAVQYQFEGLIAHCFQCKCRTNASRSLQMMTAGMFKVF